MSRRPTCKYLNTPRGCRQGANCKFSHDSSAISNSPVARPSGSQSSPARSHNTPAGVCNFYWSRGDCNRGFECRFKHTTPNSSQTTSFSQGSATTAPFLAEGGLANITGSGVDAFFSNPDRSLSPAEAHNHLRRFLVDDYRFRKPFDVYAFLVPFNSANSSNTSWSSEDGALFLSTIATGNGLLRLNDILTWSTVATTAGSNPVILSFQRGYLPLLRFMSSNFVVKSTLSHLVNGLYMRLLDNFEVFSKNVETCMDAIMEAQSFKDPNAMAVKEPMGGQVMDSLATILFECLTRFKNATATYPQLTPLVKCLCRWNEVWATGVSSVTPCFDDVLKDNKGVRDHFISHLKGKMERLASIVDREQAKFDRNTTMPTSTKTFHALNEGLLAALHTTYDGPGVLRVQGPRHDNDFVDIQDIRVAPTHDELVCHAPPFLPANIYGAPHPLPLESMERLLDIQFRLLREELIAPLRTSVQLVRDDMLSPRPRTQLSDIIAKRGGKYRGFADAQDSIMFNVYTNVQFSPLTPDKRGLSVNLSFDAPPGRARSNRAGARAAFWESMSGKRLMAGGLIGLVWKSRRNVAVHLGTISSSLRDVSESARQSADRVSAKIVFFDPAVDICILNVLKNPASDDASLKLLIEAPVMFEAIRPFLEALRVEPESLPFKQHLVQGPPEYFTRSTIAPPKYAQLPGFAYQLASLFSSEAGIDDLKMVVSDPNSVAAARDALKQSRLDPSQAEAVVDALTREVALIQGPPGTGKSYTGVELLRILNQHAKPILMIAFTNHALDHLLTSVLDAGITNKIVRLGSRSSDERISKYSLETMETVAGQSRLNRTFACHYRELKLIEKEISMLMNKFKQTSISSDDILDFIKVQHPEHFEHILQPPSWVSTLRDMDLEDSAGWVTTDRRGKAETEDKSFYGFWLRGRDLDFLDLQYAPKQESHLAPYEGGVTTQNRFIPLLEDTESIDSTFPSISDKSQLEDSDASDSDEEALEPWERPGAWGAEQPSTPSTPRNVQQEAVATVIEETGSPNESNSHSSDLSDPLRFFHALGFLSVPATASGERSLNDLLDEGAMWTMSRLERRRLHDSWTLSVRNETSQNRLREFEDLRRKHVEILKKYNEGKDETRRQLLKDVDIIGCTTTGAAKLTTLLKGIGPRIMLVEEAGQVLEAHVLGSLVPSVEHLILIGDPLQLRPTLNNYSLSMDSRRGSELYKFDMSLMERLSSSGFPMSQIDVQRRMRPEISNLIRETLYPRLIDHDIVKGYSNVRGFTKNVFFFNHDHKENGGSSEETTSKFNMFEVSMIKDLVLYLLRQGTYSQEGDIVVLCAYLGQLAKLRDALSEAVAVVIDERDQEALAEKDEERDDLETHVEHVKVSRRVRLRTVDNYQGEEAKIIILSLVRNSGAVGEDVRGNMKSIGFLKSENRTNVALSRAKEGLYILGNAAQLASKSRMWRGVIEQLEAVESIGTAFPIACQRHPTAVEYVSMPGQLPQFAPDGGCLRPCDARLKCGHVCSYKCHPDDPNHLAVLCSQDCTRLCSRGHPCGKECSQPCGPCMFEVAEVQLPCGHSCPSVPCYRLDDLENINCGVIIRKALITCEHFADMACSADPESYVCKKQCGGVTTCCGRDCRAQCHQCQMKNATSLEKMRIDRKIHVQHNCEKLLYCAHRCSKPCSLDHECATTCNEECRQKCVHTRCRQNCSTPCAPCQEPCTWNCAHQRCHVACGSVCARIPCDRRCNKNLACGHQCPSVCGEDCSIQVCPLCAPNELRAKTVDLVLGLTLADIVVDDATLDNLLITLPSCGHFFTVETLDGVCSIGDFYTCGESGWIGLRAPQNSSGERRKPPVCPTCRTAITSPRYGRVFKSADLDILENNVISRMSRQLSSIQKSLSGVNKSEVERQLMDALTNVVSVSSVPCPRSVLKDDRRAREKILTEIRSSPLPSKYLIPTETLFTISPAIASIWKKVTQPLIQIYSQATKVANTRSAHLRAWESAFSFLYQQEMELAVADPGRAPRRLKEHALRMARMNVGQPQPRGDKRFLVEAIWATLHIRFYLADLARLWLEGIGGKRDYSPQQKQMWACYALFILNSCAQDVRIALDIAEESEGRRQITRTMVLLMRVDLERFRLNLEIMRQSGKLGEERRRLADDALEKKEIADQHVHDVYKAHCARLPQDGEEWIKTHFLEIATTIRDEWANIEKSVRAETFYQPVSLEEKIAIVKALDFSHTGHFYNCPNGHTFVITECGGANMRSTCPECGAGIGGANHNLDSQNTRAMDFEEVARQQGAARSPFTWGV